tara:strand:+ start:1110 stop:4127 length:3018 start_codon:yes stop_codon:yes gene_type:complete
MAYQPTRDRKYGVTTTGTASATGLRAMANAFKDIGQSVRQVSQARREVEFSNAMLEAELAGRSAVTRDKDGRLKPINNLDWDSGLLFTEDRNRAFDVYKRVAVNTYATALKVDTEKYASNIFNENTKNPDGIISSGEAYLSKLEQELPADVYSQVASSVESSFLNKINTAKANLLAFQKKDAEVNAKQQLKNITNEIANLTALKLTTDSTMSPDIETRLEELIGERDNLEEEFIFAGFTPNQFEEMVNNSKQFVFARSSNEYIKHFYKTNDKDMVASYLEIAKIKKSLKGNPNVDIEAIEQGMKQSLQEAWTIDNEAKKVKDAMQLQLYESARLDIKTGDLTTTEQILQLVDEDGDALRDGYMASLISELNPDADAKERANKEAKAASNKWKNDVQSMIARYKNNEIGREKLGKEIMREIRVGQLNTDSGIPGYDWAGFYDTFISLEKKHHTQLKKSDNDIFMSGVEAEMHESSNYARDPGHFRNLTEYLTNQRIIGSHEGAYMTVSKWNAKVNKYAEDWETNRKKMIATKNAFINSENGLANKAQDLVNVDGFVTDIMLPNGKKEPLDIYSTDPVIREKSLDAVVKYSVLMNTVHPHILPLLQNFVNIDDEGTYELAIKLYTDIMDGYKKKKGKLRYSMGYHRGLSYMAANKVPTGLIEFGRVLPFEKANTVFAQLAFKDANRTMNKIDTKDADPLVWWKEVIESATDEETITSWLLSGATGGWIDIDDVPDHQRAMLNQFREQGGVNLSGAIFDRNPQLLNLMIEMATAKVVHNRAANNFEGHKQAILEVMGELGGHIGFTQDSEGEVYLSLHPYMQEFQREMPDGMELQPESVFQNIRDVFSNMHKANGVMWDNKYLELFEEGNFILVPNETYGEQIDYKVLLQDKYGNQILLLDNYRYNYKTSRDFKAYNTAMEKFQDNGTLKKLWSAIPGMDDVMFRGQVAKWQQIYTTEGVASKVIDLYNAMGNTLGGYNFVPIDPEKAEVTDDEWQDFFYSLTTLGIK